MRARFVVLATLTLLWALSGVLPAGAAAAWADALPVASHDVEDARDAIDEDDHLDVHGGEIVFEVDDTPVGTGEAARLVRGEALGPVRLAVVGLHNDGDHDVTMVMSGEAPEGAGVGTSAEEIGDALLTPESYDAVDAAIGMANPFGEDADTVLLDAGLTIADDAPLGEWTLHWGVREVLLDEDPPRYGEAFALVESYAFEVVDAEPGLGVAAAVALVAAAGLVVLAAFLWRRRTRGSTPERGD